MVATIITSAAVGAIVSSVITLAGQWFERRSRRKELLLTKAMELAFRRTDFVKELAFKTGADATFRDDVSLAAEYYKIIEHLLDDGALPASFKEAESKSGESKPK